jgi:hypothetical protein
MANRLPQMVENDKTEKQQGRTSRYRKIAGTYNFQEPPVIVACH